MRKMTHSELIMMTLICLSLTFTARADSLSLVNYDDDPNLAAAIDYDKTQTADALKADRELAEKYYLEYLTNDIPSFQKARVYLRLGVLYTVASDPERGIMPEYEKGYMYLKKVLELEPECIDDATIRARTLLATSPVLPIEERIQKLLDVYEWISSFDDDKIKKNWLPLDPNQKSIRKVSLMSLQNSIPSIKYTASINAVSAAASLPNSQDILLEIIQRFPDTEIAELAREELNIPIDNIADDTLSSLEGGPSLIPPPEVIPTNLESQDNEISEENSPKESNSEALVLADTHQMDNDSNSNWKIIFPIILCVVLAGGFLFYLIKRVGQHKANR
jgi:hypothetical protein